MFFWIALILFILFTFIYNAKEDCEDTWIEKFWFLTFFVVFISLIAFVITYIPANANYKSTLEEQKGLEYKVTISEEIKDDYLIRQIQNWNKNLAYNQAMAHNFWFGIYIPNYYDKLDYIEYNLKTKEEVEPYEHIINDPDTIYINADQ